MILCTQSVLSFYHKILVIKSSERKLGIMWLGIHISPKRKFYSRFMFSGGLASFEEVYLFSPKSGLFMILTMKTFQNIVGKGENAGNQHFLLNPQCFLPFLNQISTFESYLFCRLQMCSI